MYKLSGTFYSLQNIKINPFDNCCKNFEQRKPQEWEKQLQYFSNLCKKLIFFRLFFVLLYLKYETPFIFVDFISTGLIAIRKMRTFLELFYHMLTQIHWLQETLFFSILINWHKQTDNNEFRGGCKITCPFWKCLFQVELTISLHPV